MSDVMEPSEFIRNRVDPYQRMACAVLTQSLVEYRELKKELDEARPWYAYSHRRDRINEWACFPIMPDLYRDVKRRLDEVVGFLTTSGWVHELSGVPADYLEDRLNSGLDLSALTPMLKREQRKRQMDAFEDEVDRGEA